MHFITTKRLVNYFIAIFFILFSYCSASAQSPVFWNYNSEKGLPSYETYYVMQDSKGFVWIATSNGVCYFDGYTFKNLNMDNGLPDNTVFDIYEDYKHRIWFISFSGKLSYYQNDSIYEYAYNDKMLESFELSPIYCRKSFRVDSLDNVKINFFDMLPLTISKSGEIITKNIKNNANIYIYSEKGKSLYASPYNASYLKGNTKYNTYNLNGNLLSVENSKKNIFAKKLLSIAQNKNGNTCFTYGNLLLEFENNKLKYSRYFNNDIIYIDYDKKGNLWVCERGFGAYCFKNGQFQSDPDFHYLDGNSVTCILFDDENGIWFTTRENGVYYMLNNNVNSFSKKDGLIDEQITSLAFSGETVWIGGKKNSYYSLFNNKIEAFTIKSAVETEMLKMYFDSISNNLYLSTGSGCYFVPVTKFNLSKQLPLKKVITDAIVKDIITDQNKNLWFATISSALYIKNNKQVYSSLNNDNFGRRFNTCCDGLNGELWLGGNLGLYICKKKQGKINSYTYKYLGDSIPIFENRINSIRKSEFDNRIWLGTKGKGIIIWNKGKIITINKNNGLLSNNISSLFIINECVWVGTDKGLNQITWKNSYNDKFTIKSYTISDGLASNEITDICYLNENVYLATKGGLTVFNPNKLNLNNVPPKIYFTAFTVLNKDTTVLNDYILPYYKNHITIHYTGISFKSLGNLTYKYRFIQNGDTTVKWAVTTDRQITFPYLPSGDYAFQVYAFNKDNVSSIKPATIHFTIKTPFWKTWWFYSVFFILIISIIILFFLYRLKNIKHRNSLSQKANNYLLLALSRQMNPHFIYNSLNSIQNYILKNDRIKASEYLSKFASLMRSILHNSSFNFIKLQEEIDALTKYMDLESIRFANKFNYTITVDPQIDTTKCSIPPLLFQPFIENSILHGLLPKEGCGEIKINIEKNNNSIYCTIEDNGIGRIRSAELNKSRSGHKSVGIQIAQNRINLINSLQNCTYNIEYIDLYDKDTNEPTGTKVRIIWIYEER